MPHRAKANNRLIDNVGEFHIASNVIHQQPDATMQVPERMLAEVQSHNDIRYDDDFGHTELLSSTYFETGCLSLSDME